MTEEEKAVAAAAEAEAKSKEEAAKKASEEIDFKAELEKAKAAKEEKEEQLRKAEFTIEKLKSKKEAPEIDLEAIEESIREKLSKEQEAKFEQLKTEQAKSLLESEIAKITSNPDEQELIRFNYENRIVKSGHDAKSISEDLNNAYLISNKPRLEKTMEELRKKAISNMTKNGGEAAPSESKAPGAKLSPEMEAWVKKTAAARGLSEEVVRAKLAKNS